MAGLWRFWLKHPRHFLAWRFNVAGIQICKVLFWWVYANLPEDQQSGYYPWRAIQKTTELLQEEQNRYRRIAASYEEERERRLLAEQKLILAGIDPKTATRLVEALGFKIVRPS